MPIAAQGAALPYKTAPAHPDRGISAWTYDGKAGSISTPRGYLLVRYVRQTPSPVGRITMQREYDDNASPTESSFVQVFVPEAGRPLYGKHQRCEIKRAGRQREIRQAVSVFVAF